MQTRALLGAVALAALAAAPAGAASGVDQMVVFRDGSARVSHPSLAQTSPKVGRKRCAVAGGTALAALVRSRVARLSLKDYGACSKRPRDGSGLFVAAIGPDRNRGSDGWVYKVGNVLATAGAADPGGPLGRGPIHAGAHVTWLWCHVTTRDRGCPHTLTLTALKAAAGTLALRARSYDDRGRGAQAAGATVHVAGRTATAGKDGVARLALPAGRYTAFADQPGRIRSFPLGAVVR